MKTLRRIVVVLTTVAALGIAALGIVSYRVGLPDDTIWISHDDAQPAVHLAMIGGIVHVVYVRAKPEAVQQARSTGASLAPQEGRFGQFYAKRASIGSVEAEGVGVPFWAPVTLFMVPPVAAFVRGPWRRRRRRLRGECIHCGYSLTGLTERRCPECGNPFELPVAAS